jgi:hypothetical protein
MICEPIALLCTCEIAGRVRGKGFPVIDLSARLKSGGGWVPTNTMISALRPIADTAFGATGDLILVPDPATELKVNFDDGSAPDTFPRQASISRRRFGMMMSRAAAKNSGRILSCASLNVAFWTSTTSSAVRAGSAGRMRLLPCRGRRSAVRRDRAWTARLKR